MKKSIFLALLLSFNVLAGGYYQSVKEGYDPITGLFYYPVIEKTESGGVFSSRSKIRISNILIFDPESETQSFLFKPEQVWNIQAFTFETGLNSNGIGFYSGGGRVLNNSSKLSREIKNKLLIITQPENSDINTMWFATKQGKELKQVHTFPSTTKWHIDIKNSKIRFITHTNKVIFKSIEW
ncbi:hypothetical protein DS2_15564 [Catenovulum agarivorans DS-2]|uniref:Uncharacterized protein n=1 Tax=Catenovulum agarivorans DS-2 TaxID=1328313 RepID=W7Q7P7_9ALTE|nr:hypothetical protein [Catenovulum agarivorans]EWH08819.1 hypothetical protein DS2_15564 [Catenovulum agarivorans DS-2]